MDLATSNLVKIIQDDQEFRVDVFKVRGQSGREDRVATNSFLFVSALDEIIVSGSVDRMALMSTQANDIGSLSRESSETNALGGASIVSQSAMSEDFP